MRSYKVYGPNDEELFFFNHVDLSIEIDVSEDEALSFRAVGVHIASNGIQVITDWS